MPNSNSVHTARESTHCSLPRKPLPRLLAVKEAIYQLGIGRTEFYELLKDEKLTTVMIGRRRLVPLEAIEEFIAGLMKQRGEQ